MNEYLEQTLLNAVKSMKSLSRPLENSSQWIIDEDDHVWYLEGYINGIHSRWTVNKHG